MTHLRLALGLVACALLPAVALAALAGYVYDQLVTREADLFAGIEDEMQSWILA